MKKIHITLKQSPRRNRVQQVFIKQGRRGSVIEPKKGKGHHYNRRKDQPPMDD